MKSKIPSLPDDVEGIGFRVGAALTIVNHPECELIHAIFRGDLSTPKSFSNSLSALDKRLTKIKWQTPTGRLPKKEQAGRSKMSLLPVANLLRLENRLSKQLHED